MDYYAVKAIIYSSIYAVNFYLAQNKQITNHQNRRNHSFITLFTTKKHHNANQ